jgi:DNA-binding NtrC family response regulator
MTKGVSVLLVDDDARFIDVMSRRLELRGFTVASASSGAECLSALDDGGTSRYDVVVLDVRMPGMDGLETLSTVRSRHPLVEIVMLTGQGTVENVIEAMKLGAFDYMMKPCDLEMLIAKLDQAAARKREHEAKILQARATLLALRRGE